MQERSRSVQRLQSDGPQPGGWGSTGGREDGGIVSDDRGRGPAKTGGAVGGLHPWNASAAVQACSMRMAGIGRRGRREAGARGTPPVPRRTVPIDRRGSLLVSNDRTATTVAIEDGGPRLTTSLPRGEIGPVGGNPRVPGAISSFESALDRAAGEHSGHLTNGQRRVRNTHDRTGVRRVQDEPDDAAGSRDLPGPPGSVTSASVAVPDLRRARDLPRRFRAGAARTGSGAERSPGRAHPRGLGAGPALGFAIPSRSSTRWMSFQHSFFSPGLRSR